MYVLLIHRYHLWVALLCTFDYLPLDSLMAKEPRFATYAPKRSAPNESRCRRRQVSSQSGMRPNPCPSDSSRKIIAVILRDLFVLSFVPSHMPDICYRHDDTRIRKCDSCHVPKSLLHCLAVLNYPKSRCRSHFNFPTHPNHPRPLSQRPMFFPILSACAAPIPFLPSCQTSYRPPSVQR